jgi:hypothetical protein
MFVRKAGTFTLFILEHTYLSLLRLSKLVGQHQRVQQRMAMDMELRVNQMKV